MSIYLGKNRVCIKYTGKASSPFPPTPTPSSSSYEDVCKEVEFCQNKLIEQGGKSSYSGAWIGLRYSGIDYEDFTLGSSNVVAIRTSDGAFYSYANDGASVTHHWDNSKDFDIEGIETEHRFNWVIYYFSADSIVSYSSYLDCAKVVNIVYVFDMDLKFAAGNISQRNKWGLSSNNDILQSFDFINQHRCYENSKGKFSYFCYYCSALTKLPDSLDTSSGTDFSSFCSNCYSLTKLPDSLNTSSGTNFSHFCQNCYSLTKLPDSLDTSSGTDFDNFCSGCYSLTKLPDSLDTSSGTKFGNFCYYCYSLTKLPDSLDTSSGIVDFSYFCRSCNSLLKANIILPVAYDITTLNASNKLTVESMRYIADHAPTTSSHTLTIGSTNIARANKYDPTIITTLNSKGWTVN